jgi:hypothetical protein
MNEGVAVFPDAMESGCPSLVDSVFVSYLDLVKHAAEVSKGSGGWIEVEDI